MDLPPSQSSLMSLRLVVHDIHFICSHKGHFVDDMNWLLGETYEVDSCTTSEAQSRALAEGR